MLARGLQRENGGRDDNCGRSRRSGTRLRTIEPYSNDRVVRHPGIPRKIGGKLCIGKRCYAALSFAAGEAGGSVARFGVPNSGSF
jgi:hypothetical protein